MVGELCAAGVRPTMLTWNALFEPYVSRSDVDGARLLMDKLRVLGVHPNEMARTTILEACVNGVHRG